MAECIERYIELMRVERDELCGKIKRLERAIVKFQLSTPKRVVLMENQLKSMKDYLFYLEERLHYELTLSKKPAER